MDTRFDVEIRHSESPTLPVEIWVRNAFSDLIARHGFEDYESARAYLEGTCYCVVHDAFNAQ